MKETLNDEGTRIVKNFVLALETPPQHFAQFEQLYREKLEIEKNISENQISSNKKLYQINFFSFNSFFLSSLSIKRIT